MHQQKKIVVPTLLAAIFTGIAIRLIAGPPPHQPKPVNAHQSMVSVK
jgi:hypothetical protein